MEFDSIAYINEPRWQESRLGLERIRELLERMGRPQDRLRFVHVAGTNGKGSVCSYLASVLRCAGLRVGLFTSPYLIDFEERIRVGGENISLDELRDVTLFMREHAEAMAAETGEHPTEFELMTAVAFEHFVRSACDIVVCEVGLGGRLDSTNAIDAPEVCVIARIGLDHVGMLGDTPAAIAREKAGIVKAGATVVSWPQEDAGAAAAVREAAERCGCELVVPDFSLVDVGGVSGDERAFSYAGEAFRTRLLATYQPYNAVLAIEAARTLARRGWAVDAQAIADGIAEASWPGRFEVVPVGGRDSGTRHLCHIKEGQSREARQCVADMTEEPGTAVTPTVVVDGGHNPQGAAALADSLRDVFPGEKVVFVMSVLADKDYRAMAREVAPLARAFVCATPPNPRALAAGELATAVREEVPGVEVFAADLFSEAIEEARRLAGPDGIVCAFGSLYSVAAIKEAL